MKRNFEFLIVPILLTALAGCANPGTGRIPAPKFPPLPPATRASRVDASLRTAAEQEINRAFASNDPVLRANAIEASQRTLGNAAASKILLGLGDADPLVRFAAGMAAGTLKLQDAQPRLQTLANDTDTNVQIAVRYALHRLGDVRLSHDFEKYAVDPDPHIRANTVLALGLLEEPTALRILHALHNDPDPIVRLQVAEAMYRLGDAEARTRLVAGTISAYPEDRIVSLLALASTHDRRVIQNLRGQLMTEDPLAALAAARACGMVGSDDGLVIATNALDAKDPRQRAMAALALGEIGRADQQSRLSPLLRDTEAGVRLAAATAILQLKGY